MFKKPPYETALHARLAGQILSKSPQFVVNTTGKTPFSHHSLIFYLLSQYVVIFLPKNPLCFEIPPNAPKSRPIHGGYYPHTKSDTGKTETPNIARPG
jgi:hypothetical protein